MVVALYIAAHAGIFFCVLFVEVSELQAWHSVHMHRFVQDSEARKKGKRGENWEKKENCKREGGKLEMEVGKVIKRGEDLFFFFFFAFHFWKRQKFVLGLPKWEFTGKKMNKYITK